MTQYEPIREQQKCIVDSPADEVLLLRLRGDTLFLDPSADPLCPLCKVEPHSGCGGAPGSPRHHKTSVEVLHRSLNVLNTDPEGLPDLARVTLQQAQGHETCQLMFTPKYSQNVKTQGRETCQLMFMPKRSQNVNACSCLI